MAKLDHVERLAYSVGEAAAALGVSEHAVYQLVHSEGFPALKIGSSWRISREGLAEWVLEESRSDRKDPFGDCGLPPEKKGASGAANTGGGVPREGHKAKKDRLYYTRRGKECQET